MDVILLSIGQELLKGRIANTNAQYMARCLYASGFTVREILCVADDEDLLIQAFRECLEKATTVIATGGLGPTRDDVTKSAACRFFGCRLLFDPELFKQLEQFFQRLGYKTFPELSRNQALVPEGARILPNRRGTASGLLFDREGRLLFLLPGVPLEMKALLEESVLPILIERFGGGRPEVEVVRTIGLGESVIAEKIEAGLGPGELARLAYYPHGGMVDIVISGPADGPRSQTGLAARVAAHVAGCLGEYVYSRDERGLFEVLAGILSERSLKLAVAESCTGGMLSKQFTDLPGASRYFQAGVVSYSNASKTTFLEVPAALIEAHGAVSEPVARAMCEAVREKCRADYSLAVTGVAGPDGGSPGKPVGTVFIVLSGPGGTEASRFNFSGDREQIRHRSSVKAAELLWRKLRELPPATPEKRP